MKILRAAVLTLVAISVFQGCTPEKAEVAVLSVELSKHELNLETGASDVLRVSVSPSDATDKKFTFSSSDSGIAAVTDKGKVTGISEGTAVISVSAGGCGDKCTVNVVPKAVLARTAEIKPSAVMLAKGEEKALSLYTDPILSLLDETPEWTSSNEDVVTVDGNGKICATGTGSSTVKAKLRNCESKCVVTVTDGFIAQNIDPLEKLIRGGSFVEMDYPLDVARGETASVQICITAIFDTDRIKAELLYFNKDGDGIDIEPYMYWEREVECSGGWTGWAGGAPSKGQELNADFDRYPDPLMPCESDWNVKLKAQGTSSATISDKVGLWMDFDIPRDIEAGLYKGAVRISGVKSNGQELSVEKEFSVNIFPVTLPEEQGLCVINWSLGNYKYMNNGIEPAYPNGRAEYDALVERFMNRYGQNAWRIEYASPGNNGGVDGKGASVASVKEKDGVKYISYDFDKSYGRYIREFIENCPGLRMVHGSPFAPNDGTLNVHYVDENGKIGKGNFSIDAPEAGEFLANYFSQLRDYLASQKMPDGIHSWLDCYAQSIFDEPNSENCKYWAALSSIIKKAAPEIKMVEAITTDGDALIPEDLLDYPCPKLNHIEDYPATGNQVQWMYVCCDPQGNYANRFVRLQLIKARLLHWCNYYYNAPGFLHWGLRYWQRMDEAGGSGDVYGQIRNIWPGGDDWCIYPGYHEVYPSIRLCAERDGIRDYDLLKMVEERDRAQAEVFCKKVVKGKALYELNTLKFRQIRKDILDYLSK